MEDIDFKRLSQLFTKSELEAVNKNILAKFEKYLEHENLLLENKQNEIEQVKANNQHLTKENHEKQKKYEEDIASLREEFKDAERKLKETAEILKFREVESLEFQNNIRNLEVKCSSMESQVTLLNSEKESFKEMLSRRESEVSSLQNQLKVINEQLLSSQKEKWQLKEKEEEIASKELTLKVREEQINYKVSLLEKQVIDLENEVEEKNVNLLIRSKDSSTEILRLKDELDRTKEDLRLKEDAVARLKEKCDDQLKSIDELSDRIRSFADVDNQVKSGLRNELLAQKKMTEMYKEHEQLAEKAAEQAVEKCKQLQETLKKAVESCGDYETQLEEEKLRHAEDVENLQTTISKLEEELHHANELLEQKTSIAADISELSPKGASFFQSGITVTRMYTDYNTLSEKYARLEMERDHLQKVLEDVEEKIPLIKQQAFELQKEREENEDLRQKIEKDQSLVSRCRYEAEMAKSESMYQKRQNSRLEILVKDLQRQVVTLLRENHQFKTGVAMIENLEDYEYDVSTPEAQKTIGEHLVVFKSIDELQENNLRLLATIRKLSEESEVAESAAVAEKTRDLNIEVTSLRSQLKSMQDSRANTMQLVERLKKEYESQKSLADSLNMSIQQRNEADASKVEAKEERIAELKVEVKELHDKIEVERKKAEEAISKEKKHHQEAIQKLTEENNSLKVSVEKVSAILEQEKAQFQKLAGVLKMVRMENQALTEKSVSLSGLTKTQENEINSLKQDKLKVEEQHERAKVTISQIQRERQSLRDKISQLNNEIVRLQAEVSEAPRTSRIETMLKQELLQKNSVEVDALKEEITRLRTECEIVRKQMSEQLEFFKSSREEWRHREKELKHVNDELILKELKLRNEVNEYVDKADKMQKRLDEATESLKIHQRLAVPKSPHAQQPMSARFSTIQMELLEAKNYIEELNSEIEWLKAKIKEAEDESTQYRSLADSRDQQLKEVTEQTQNSMKTFEKELNILKGEEEAKSAQILSLKSSLDMRMAQIECFEKVKEAIREERQKEVEKLENDLKAANVTMKFLGQKTTDLQNEIKAVKTSADEKDDNYRNEVIAHAWSVDAMKLLREEFKEVSKRLVAAEKIAADAVSKEKLIEAKCSVDVQALETRLSELNSSNIELRKINEILQDQVAKLSEAAEAERNLSVSSTLDEERTNQQLLEVISFLRRDSKMTRTHLERSEAECSQLTAQLKQIRLQLESSEADLKRERTTQRASLGAPEGETLLRKIETMTCLQDSNRRLRDELTILQSQFDEVKNKLDTATKELEPLKEKNRKLNEQFDSISVEATVLRTEIARVKTQSAVFSRGVTERAKFQAEKESLEKSLKSKEAEVARIKNSLDNALKQVESAQKNFDQSKITVEQLNARNEQMKSKMEELNAKLDESDKSRRALQEELNSIRDNLGTTSQELTILKADFEKKTQELAKANNTSSQLKAIGRKYKNMYEEIRKQLDEVKKEEPSATAVPVKEETVDETIPKKDGIRRVTTGELFSEPSTTTEGIKQESGKVAELESSLKSVTESRDSLLSQMASLQKELGAMKKENEDLQVHGEKLQKEIDLAKVTTSEKDQLHVTVNDLNQKNKAHLQEIENLSREVSLLRVKVAKLEKDLAESIGEKERLTTELQRIKEQKLARTLPQEAPTANVRPMTSPAPQQQSTSKGLALQTRLTPSGPPTASIRPMAMQTRTVGQATPIVTCTATEASTISSVPAILSVNLQAERPVTPVVALVPPTPSTEVQASEGPSEGASTSQAKSMEQEAPVSESGTSVQKPKRQREPDSTPDESLKKRTREEELSQEPVTQTPESIQREADLRRSLLAARRTTGFAVTVKEGPRSAVVQPSSSAIEEIEISSESENEPTWEEGNDEVSYDEGEVTEVSEDIEEEEDEEGSEEEQSNDDSGLSNENEATVGEEMMAINEQRGELEHPESSLAEQPSRSEIGDENGEVPLSKGSSPKKQRSGDSSNETGTSTQVAARPFLFGVSPAMEGQTSGTRDIEAADAGQLEEGEGLEVLFEEVAEVSTSGQEASAGDGTEMVDSPASGNDGTTMAQSSSLQARSIRGSQGYTRGGSTLRRLPQRQQISSQQQFSPSRDFAGGRARRSRGSFK